MYWPISSTDEIIPRLGFITKREFGIKIDLYLNTKLCIYIFPKIRKLNLGLLLLKQITLFSKLKAVSAHEAKTVSW